MATTQQPPPRLAGSGAAAGTAAAGGAAGAAAAGAGAAQGAQVAGALAKNAAKVAGIVAALVAFLARKRTLDEAYLRAQLAARIAGRHAVAPNVIDELIAEEQRRDEAFALKQSERVMADSNRILAIEDPEQRKAEMSKLAEREKRYAQQRAEAMASRAIAAIDRVGIRMESPQGAFWKLDPTVKEHTKGCLVMGGRFWPWEVLDRVHPPRHPGCPCRLVGYGQAIRDGLMTAGEVPNVRDAVRSAMHVLMEAEPDAPEREALQELLEEYEGRAEEGPPDGDEALRAALIEAGLATPESLAAVGEAYNPAEPRDFHGRWRKGGAHALVEMLRGTGGFKARQAAHVVHDAFKRKDEKTGERGATLKQVVDARAEAAPKFEKDLLSLLRQARPRYGEGKVKVAAGSDPEMAARVQDAATLFPAEWIEKAGEVHIVNAPGARVAFLQAEHSRYKKPTIILDETANRGVVAHEMAHWIEANVPEVGEAARAFYARRTKGKGPVEHREGTPGERIKDGGFVTPYIGKFYEKTGGTEVLSMAMEALVRGAIRIEDDPDHFRFVLGLLAGEPRGST